MRQGLTVEWVRDPLSKFSGPSPPSLVPFLSAKAFRLGWVGGEVFSLILEGKI